LVVDTLARHLLPSSKPPGLDLGQKTEETLSFRNSQLKSAFATVPGRLQESEYRIGGVLAKGSNEPEAGIGKLSLGGRCSANPAIEQTLCLAYCEALLNVA
jgi:hypothetical protein